MSLLRLIESISVTPAYIQQLSPLLLKAALTRTWHLRLPLLQASEVQLHIAVAWLLLLCFGSQRQVHQRDLHCCDESLRFEMAGGGGVEYGFIISISSDEESL